MKGLRKLAFISAACMVFSGTVPVLPAMPVQAEEETLHLSGFCGENVQFELYGGDLNIWGEGEMFDFGDPDDPLSTAAPWGREARYVHITGNVTHIGANAFANCTELWYMGIADCVKTIGAHAFYNCSELNVLEIPASVARLEGKILDGDVHPREIVIENRNAEIAEDAFVFPRSFDGPVISGYKNSTAQTYAEARGYKFSALYEPDPSYPEGQECGYNVKWKLDKETGTLTISGDGFAGSIENYFEDYDPFGSFAEYQAGKTYSGTAAGPVPWAQDRDAIRHIVIEEGIYGIGSYAFFGCKNLETVELPYSMNEIGPFAFSGTALKSITIPSKVLNIETGAFHNCTALEKVVFEGALNRIDSYAFNQCTALKSFAIPAGVTALGDGAFSGSTQLAEISVPESVCEFGADIFAGTAWQEKQLSKEPYLVINRHLIACGTANKGKLTLPDDVLVIEENVFAGQTDITAVTLGKSTASIHANAFKGCKGLTSVLLPESLDEIQTGAFSGCTALTEIGLPDSLLTLEQEAFAGCTALKSLTIPVNVSLIRPDVCKDCTALETVTVLNPNAIFPTTNAVPFTNEAGGFTGTLRGYADSSAQKYAKAHGWKFESLGAAPPAAPVKDYCGEHVTWVLEEDGTLRISGQGDMFSFYNPSPWVTMYPGAAAVSNDMESDLERGMNVIFGDNGGGLFSPRTRPWNSVLTKIKTVVVEDGVTSVGAAAFTSCPNLESVKLADSVTKINLYAFQDCGALQSVTLPKGLKSLDERCFYMCSSLPEISIPTGTEFIGLDAFAGCTSLASVTLPDTILDIENRVFEDTPWLEARMKQDEFVIESGILLAYSGRPKDSIVIPDGVRIIGGGALEKAAYDETSASRAVEVIIPEGVTTICKFAFCWNSDILKITMPDTVTDIKDSAFFNCFGLREIRLSENLKTIGSYAFGNCESLTEVTIPKNVVSIDTDAFSRCRSLQTVTILNPRTNIADSRDTFSNPKTLGSGEFTGTIRGFEGSTAQSYAKRYRRTFEMIAENAPNAVSKRGDLNGDNVTDVSDAVLLARYLNSDAEAELTDQGLRNADCDQNGKTDSNDLTMILKYIAKKITF